MNSDYRILAIDPGTVTLGMCILDIDFDNFEINVVEAFTVNVMKSLGSKDQYKEIFGSRTLRLKLLSDAIYKELDQHEPDCIISESCYMGRMVTSFESLTECKVFVREAVIRYDNGMSLQFIDPLTVKYGIGAVVKLPKGTKRKKGRKRPDTKLAVRKRLSELDDLKWNIKIPNLEYLDEHTVDAVSIGYWKAKKIIDYITFDNENFEEFYKSIRKPS